MDWVWRRSTITCDINNLCRCIDKTQDEPFLRGNVINPLDQHLQDAIGIDRTTVCIGDREFIPGRPISDEIVHSLRKSAMVLILLSDAYTQSEYCRQEFEQALIMDKAIIFLVKDTIQEELLTPTMQELYKKNRDGSNYRQYRDGIGAYKFLADGTKLQDFDVYHVEWDGRKLADLFSDGEILVLASQRRRVASPTKINVKLAFDAFETLIYGEVTGNGLLRSVPDKGTWACVYQKGNPISFQEEVNALGHTSTAVLDAGNGLLFLAESIGISDYRKQEDNFRVGDNDAIYPKVSVLDDVSTWQPDRPQYTHYGGLDYVGTVDMRGEVGALTRNIVIQGDVVEDSDDLQDKFGCHIKIFNGYELVHIENAELRYVGQQAVKGRYPIHFHLCTDVSSSPPYIRESIVDNVAYHTEGHCFFLEEGGETYNQTIEFLDYKSKNKVVNNAAAGGQGFGFCFFPFGASASLGLMAEGENNRTNHRGVYNNVAHSNLNFGIKYGGILHPNGTTAGGGVTQPLADPMDILRNSGSHLQTLQVILYL
ncbi:CEIP2-like protein [Mya arenaria]|uniref:CEIP2-like protein n=1 Tax=Mya arenaria TaxID=6604 RepID=A0ABY7DEI8_MYAAR|nr:CEIP2-like protein [Mya arenaria]